MGKRGNTKFAKEQEAPEVRFEKLRKYQQFLLIVCEDQRTEPAYLQSFVPLFPEHTLFLEIVGAGLDSLGVVLEAIQRKTKLAGLTKKQLDEIWVVFDKDDADLNAKRIARFDEAFATANDNGFKVAWSNEVFELWLLLHFEDVNPTVPLPRQEVYKRLKDAVNNLIGSAVIIDGHSNPAVIPYLGSVGSENAAIQRASALLQYHSTTAPIDANPCTTMQKLVVTLREWINYYNYKP